MALIKCPECGKEISNKAKVCPHCGIKIRSGALKISAIFLVGIFVVVSFFFIVTNKMRKYERANMAFENGDYEIAYNLFSKLGNYKDALEKAEETNLMLIKTNDNTAPVFKNIVNKVDTMVNEKLDIGQWIKNNSIVVEDDVSGIIDDIVVIGENDIDYSTPGNYLFYLVAKDDAGNETREEITLEVMDYIVHSAYTCAINISDAEIKNSDNGYIYEDIILTESEASNPTAGSIYRETLIN